MEGKHFAKPAATDEPIAADEPTVAAEPVVTNGPTAAVEPAATDEPIAADEPAKTTEPSDSAEPVEPGDGPHRRRRTVLRVLVAVLVLVSVTAAGAAILINSSIQRGRKAFEESMQRAIEETGSTVEYDGRTYELNEDMVTIAFIGFDNRTKNATTGADAQGQSDTIMVVALNTATGAATGIIIPRDSMVPVDMYIEGNYSGQSTMQICLQYSYGDSSEQSSELVARCASRVLYGMPIDYYFTLNIEGVGPINDSVGGVTLTPVQSVPSAGIVEGRETTLYGSKAERYVQYRDTSSVTSSLDRQARQVSYLKAFSSKVLGAASSDPGVLIGLYQTALEYTWTNLGFDQFSYLASTMLSHGMTSFDVVTLDGEMVSGESHSEFNLDKDSVYRVVLDVFYSPVDDADDAPEDAGAR